MTESSAPDTLHFGCNWDSCFCCTFPSSEETRNHGGTLHTSALDKIPEQLLPP